MEVPWWVSVISGRTDRYFLNVSIGVGSYAEDIAMDSGNGDLYVADSGTNNVSVVSGVTNSEVAVIPVGNTPTSLAYDNATGDIYVANRFSGNVSVISGSSNRVVATLSGFSHPVAVAYDGGNGDIYVADEGNNPTWMGNVTVISGATDKVVAVIPVGVGPATSGLAYDGATGDIYAVDAGNYPSYEGNVSVISGSSNSVIRTVRVGTQAASALFDPGNGDVYVTNAGSNNVSVIAGASNTLVATLAVQTSPQGMGYDADNGQVYVTNQQDTTVSIIGTLPSPGPPYPVAFLSHPPGCGFAFGGTYRPNASSGLFLPNSYPVSAPGCPNFAFLQWNTSGGVSVNSSFSSATHVVVSGNGTLFADYVWVGGSAPPTTYSVNFNIFPSSCGPVLFNSSTYANGAVASFPPGTYLAHAPACKGGWTFQDWSFSPWTLGTLQFYYTPWANISVNASGAVSAYYLPPPLVVALSASAPSTTVGTPLTLTPWVSGGVSPFTCLWSLNGTNTTQTGCSAFSPSWSHPGNYSYRIWATDAWPQVAASNSVSVTVYAPPIVPPAPTLLASEHVVSRFISDVCGATNSPNWEALEFWANVSGGTPPYSIVWYFGQGARALGPHVWHSFWANSTFSFPGATVVVNASYGAPSSANATQSLRTPPLNVPAGCFVRGIPLFEVLAIMAAVAIVLAVAVVVLRRRRKRAPPPEAFAEPATDGGPSRTTGREHGRDRFQ